MPGVGMSTGRTPLGPKASLAIACILAIIGIWVFVSTNQLHGHWETVDAQVVNTTFCPDSIHSKYPEGKYTVTYAFTTKDGQNVQASTSSCEPRVPPVGASNTIMYDPSDPSSGVMEEGDYHNWFYGSLAISVFGILGAVLVVYTMKKKMWSSESDNANNY